MQGETVNDTRKSVVPGSPSKEAPGANEVSHRKNKPPLLHHIGEVTRETDGTLRVHLDLSGVVVEGIVEPGSAYELVQSGRPAQIFDVLRQPVALIAPDCSGSGRFFIQVGERRVHGSLPRLEILIYEGGIGVPLKEINRVI